MIRLGWHRCKHCGLQRCKRRCDDPNRGAIEPGASPALERGAEALDRRGGVCTWCLGLRGSPARRRCAELIYRWRRELRSTAAGFAQVMVAPGADERAVTSAALKQAICQPSARRLAISKPI